MYVVGKHAIEFVYSMLNKLLTGSLKETICSAYKVERERVTHHELEPN